MRAPIRLGRRKSVASLANYPLLTCVRNSGPTLFRQGRNSISSVVAVARSGHMIACSLSVLSRHARAKASSRLRH